MRNLVFEKTMSSAQAARSFEAFATSCAPTFLRPKLLAALYFAVFAFMALAPTPTPACECEDASMIEAMDMQIADRARKLEQLRKGSKPTGPEKTANPWVLRREIEEIVVAKETILRGIAECRKQCLMPDNTNIYDPGSSDSGVSAECPQCSDKESALREEEARLGIALRNLDLFRREVMPETAAEMTAANFSAKNAAYERGAVHNSEVEEVYAAMIRARDAACRNSLLAESEWREQKRLESGTPLDDSYGDQPEREASNENLVYDGGTKVRRTGRTLFDNDKRHPADEWIGENGVSYTPEQIDRLRRGEDPGLSGSQVRQKAKAATGSGLESLARTTPKMAAELSDQFMDLPAKLGFDVFPRFEISDYGECMRLGRAARKYFQEVVVPSRDALRKLGSALPGGRWDTLQELKNLESRVRQARERRDNALRALIECNVRSCKPDRDAGAGLEDEAATEPRDQDTPSAEKRHEDEEGTASTGVASIPELDNDGSRPIPMMPKIELPTIGKPSLGHFLIPGLSEEPNTLRAGLTGMRPPPGQCGHGSGDVCDKLGDPRAAACTAIVDTWRKACNEVIAHRRDNDMAQCKRRCAMMASEASDANWLRAMALRTIAANDPQANGPLAEALSAARIDLFNARLDFEETVESLDEHQIHIYVNAETGAVVEHDGSYFDPSPPLVYSGSMRKRPSPQEMRQLKTAEDRITALQSTIADLTARLSALGGWRAEATAFWMGDTPQSRVGCPAQSIPEQLEQCVAFCEQQQHPQAEIIPEPLPICSGTAMLGLLYQPTSRDHLYPPGHPWREHGYGR